jgi:hypothetical protein
VISNAMTLLNFDIYTHTWYADHHVPGCVYQLVPDECKSLTSIPCLVCRYPGFLIGDTCLIYSHVANTIQMLWNKIVTKKIVDVPVNIAIEYSVNVYTESEVFSWREIPKNLLPITSP